MEESGGISNTNEYPLRNYKLGKTLGHGSFGKVKLADHIPTGHKVAIKILNRHIMSSSPEMEEKVRREIKICRLLVHPHVIRIYEAIETETDIYVVMEHVVGGELYDYMVEKRRLEEGEARYLFQQIISGVEYCHTNMVVHRDLKPENLLLDSNGNVKLADFGLSNMMQDGHFLKTSCGSPNYAAPEVISGKLYAGPEVDVWSCGVILYALLCGFLPFDDENIPHLFNKIKSGVYSIPSYLSAGARDLIGRTLVLDPIMRITTLEIRQHPWFRADLPYYLSVTPPIAMEHLIKIDEEIIEEVVRMGFERSKLIESLQNSVQNDATVTYYLLSDTRSPVSNIGAEFEEFKETHLACNYSEVNTHDFPIGVSLFPQSSREKQWLVGLQSPAHPQEIMALILRAFEGLNVRWKTNGNYNMKCLLIKIHSHENMLQPHNVVKFEMQLYKMSGANYLVDLQRRIGSAFIFMDFCASLMMWLNVA